MIYIWIFIILTIIVNVIVLIIIKNSPSILEKSEYKNYDNFENILEGELKNKNKNKNKNNISSKKEDTYGSSKSIFEDYEGVINLIDKSKKK